MILDAELNSVFFIDIYEDLKLYIEYIHIAQ